tara:strand:- start:29506 stop:29658 length:153 start_codon:yes stop_codon:yes gene_type:complete
MDEQHQMDLKEIIEERHIQNPTIIVSQLPLGSLFDTHKGKPLLLMQFCIG